jgi:transcriptional accessory protein Tex/SPT6
MNGNTMYELDKIVKDYTKKLLLTISKDYEIDLKELKKKYLKNTKLARKKKTITKLYGHNHEIDDNFHKGCKLCESHGNIFDINLTNVEYEIVTN